MACFSLAVCFSCALAALLSWRGRPGRGMVRRQGQGRLALLVLTTNVPTRAMPLASLAAGDFPSIPRAT
eukprot:2527576-Pleurochrysis_carterae.AAC.1